MRHATYTDHEGTHDVKIPQFKSDAACLKAETPSLPTAPRGQGEISVHQTCRRAPMGERGGQADRDMASYVQGKTSGQWDRMSYSMVLGNYNRRV